MARRLALAAAIVLTCSAVGVAFVPSDGPSSQWLLKVAALAASVLISSLLLLATLKSKRADGDAPTR